MSESTAAPLDRTPLHELHLALGARMVAFAGYHLPVQYAGGIIAEHTHTRAAASLFDVSHMGQVTLRGDGAAAALEALIPADLAGLAPGRMRYAVMTNDAGGIIDDLIVTNVGAYLFLVVNAARKLADIAHLRQLLPSHVAVEELAERGLIAVQGPAAATVLARLIPGAEGLAYMQAAPFVVGGIRLAVSRSGYTGEDGFEISIPASDAAGFAERLLAEPEVAPAGLGARDTLRLEAGLCLYGQDIDETTTPVEAGLAWTIGARRRRHGGFTGAPAILRQIATGVARRRVGILPEGRAPARAHTAITDPGGAPIGEVTSGGFGPTVGGPVAMGYVATAHCEPGMKVSLVVRGTALPARVARLPFVPHRTLRAKS